MKIIIVFKSIQNYWLRNLLTVFCCPYNTKAQVPKRAFEMADSIRKSRLTCPSSKIDLLIADQKMTSDNYQYYYFSYKIYLKKDVIVICEFNISSDCKHISWRYKVPDKDYQISPCLIMKRKDLWLTAKKNGLRANYRKCRYHISFEKDRIIITFQEKRRRRRYRWLFKNYYEVDYYEVDAISGTFMKRKNYNFGP